MAGNAGTGKMSRPQTAEAAEESNSSGEGREAVQRQRILTREERLA